MDSKNRSPQPPSAASGSGGVSSDVGALAGKGLEPEPVTVAVVPKPLEVAPFLTMVYDMVSDPATEEVISWSDGGGSLVVWDSHAFERDQLSRHFKHNNFTSFIRQLNTYVVEDGYEFFAKRQLVTIFSAPNYCGEFDNIGAMMSIDDSLTCSFQITLTKYHEVR